MAFNVRRRTSNCYFHQALRQNSISVNFTYLNASEDIPQLDPEQLLITARNPITRIYNKVARLNQLQRELEEEPSLPLIQSRPTSMRLECPSVVPEKDAFRLEENLDRDLTRLEQLLAHNKCRDEKTTKKNFFLFQ